MIVNLSCHHLLLLSLIVSEYDVPSLYWPSALDVFLEYPWNSLQSPNPHPYLVLPSYALPQLFSGSTMQKQSHSYVSWDPFPLDLTFKCRLL